MSNSRVGEPEAHWPGMNKETRVTHAWCGGSPPTAPEGEAGAVGAIGDTVNFHQGLHGRGGPLSRGRMQTTGHRKPTRARDEGTCLQSRHSGGWGRRIATSSNPHELHSKFQASLRYRGRPFQKIYLFYFKSCVCTMSISVHGGQRC